MFKVIAFHHASTCVQYIADNRLSSETATGKMFANQMDHWTFNNSALACMNQCAAFGYSAAGVEVITSCLISSL